MQDNLYRDWVFARAALTKIVREWSFSLSLVEFRAAIFIYDRTIGWGKEWEKITTEQMVNGVWNKENTKFFASPIGTNKNRVRKAINSLVEKGLVRKKPIGKSSMYSLVLDDMKIPKRLQNTAKKGAESVPVEGVESVPKKGAESVPLREYKERDLTIERKEKRASATLATLEKEESPLTEALYATERVKVRSQKSREERKTKKGVFVRRANSGFVPFKNSLQAVWQDLCRKYFSHVQVGALPFLTSNILHQYALSWTKVRECGEFLEFLEWTFQNWVTLGASVFSWMKDYPLSPSVQIITNRKLRGYIEQAFQEKEMWDAWRKMDEYDRKVYFLVNKRGMDQEKAEEVAKKEVGYAQERKDLEQARKMVELMTKRAKQAIEVEREALNRQRNNTQRKTHLVEVEGDFGKWD